MSSPREVRRGASQALQRSEQKSIAEIGLLHEMPNALPMVRRKVSHELRKGAPQLCSALLQSVPQLLGLPIFVLSVHPYGRTPGRRKPALEALEAL